MRKPLEFSEAEMQYIRENYAHKTAKSIAEVLSRNHHSVKRIIQKSGLCGKSRRTVWTDERLERLRALYPTTTNEELAKIFETSERSISAAAHIYRMQKAEEHIAEHRKGQFDGSRPVWNKGMKGLLIPGSEKGFFKKGNLPHNTRHDGATTVREDNAGRPYRFVRVSLRNWVHESVLVWEAAHGKIDKNMVVRHKNGDTLDNQLDNLELITKAENMARNTIHQYPEELQNIIKTLSKFNKKLKEYGS
jgi:hypothetical protein